MINYKKYLIIKLSPIKIKHLKKRNNEIIIQYLTDPTVVFHESFVLGVSMLSDVNYVMSKSVRQQTRWSFSKSKY
jgi:hypothetical protein